MQQGDVKQKATSHNTKNTSENTKETNIPKAPEAQYQKNLGGYQKTKNTKVSATMPGEGGGGLGGNFGIFGISRYFARLFWYWASGALGFLVFGVFSEVFLVLAGFLFKGPRFFW